MRIDNFALSVHEECPAKYKLRIEDGYVPLERKRSLSFGAAIHVGLAEWYRSGGNLSAACEALHAHWSGLTPSDDFRTEGYALKVLTCYAEQYPRESWSLVQGPSGPIIEQAFTLDTGLRTFDDEPIEYGGILDLPIDFGGTLYVLDHKTTTVLGKEDSNYYFQQFKPDNQMTGYVWALSKLTNRKVGGALINAIGLYKSGEVRFKRQITTRNEFEINEWLNGVRLACNEIRRCQQSGEWKMRTINCMNYGTCEYHPVHVLNDPSSRQRWLDQYYVKSPWDYEARDD